MIFLIGNTITLLKQCQIGFETLISECCDELDELVLVKIDKVLCTFTVKWIYFFHLVIIKLSLTLPTSLPALNFKWNWREYVVRYLMSRKVLNALWEGKLHFVLMDVLKLKAKGIMKALNNFRISVKRFYFVFFLEVKD